MVEGEIKEMPETNHVGLVVIVRSETFLEVAETQLSAVGRGNA